MNKAAKRLKKWLLHYLSSDCSSLVRQVDWELGDYMSISTVLTSVSKISLPGSLHKDNGDKNAFSGCPVILSKASNPDQMIFTPEMPGLVDCKWKQDLLRCWLHSCPKIDIMSPCAQINHKCQRFCAMTPLMAIYCGWVF